MKELQSILLNISKSKDLPSHDIKNARARIMSALWRLAADDFLAAHPEALEEARAEPPTAMGTYYLTLVMEVHTWEKHGCRAIDFVFPTFFGAKIQTVHLVDGEMVPDEESE